MESVLTNILIFVFVHIGCMVTVNEMIDIMRGSGNTTPRQRQLLTAGGILTVIGTIGWGGWVLMTEWKSAVIRREQIRT